MLFFSDRIMQELEIERRDLLKCSIDYWVFRGIKIFWLWARKNFNGK